MGHQKSATYSYLLAFAVGAAAILVRWLVDPMLGDRLPYITLFGAIAFISYYCGLWPSILVTIASYLISEYLFLPARGLLTLMDASQVTGFLLYCLNCGAIIALGVAMRRARRRADQSHAELDMITAHTPLLLARCDRDYRYRYVNQPCADFIGRAVSEIVGKRIADVLGEAAFAEIKPYADRALGGEHVEYEAEIPYSGPGPRFMHVVYTPERDRDGAVCGWIASILDITERRRAELMLHESEMRFRRMADSAPVLIWVSGPDKLCTWFNQVWLEFVGRNMTDELGNGWAENVHPDDFERCLKIYTTSFDAREPFAMDYRLKRHDGTYRWILDYGRPHYWAEGQFSGYIGSCIDITDRKEAEEGLRAAEHRKDEFLATLSHELRNPLAAMSSAVHLMNRKSLNADQVEHVHTLLSRQVRQMERLVDDLLSVTRITSGKITLQLECIDLNQVVRGAVEMTEPMAHAASQTIHLDTSPSHVLVDGDATRLTQVVANLIRNACKFSDAGAEVRVSVSTIDSDAVISVRDTGAGIAPENLSRIFEMFVQVDGSDANPRSGLGVGLSLAKSIVELHGGTVRAKSAGLGFGSEFTVTIPLSMSKISSTPLSPAGHSQATTRSTPDKLRILVVDDNVDSADGLRELLVLDLHDVATAYDGEEAVRMAEAFRPDAILIDIGLPKLNGIQVARFLREQPWGKDITLIAISGWGRDSDKRAALEAGFDYHATKPVDPDRLNEMLSAKKHRVVQEVANVDVRRME